MGAYWRGVRYNLRSGATFEVNILTMTQTNQETGNTRKVERRGAGDWCVQGAGQRQGRWNEAFPASVVAELERVYLGLPEPSSVEAKLEPPQSGALEEILQKECCSAHGDMAPEAVLEAKRLAFDAATRDRRLITKSVKVLAQLASRQSLRCTPADARCAGLIIGSMAILQVVLQSNPAMCLVGEEIFDQRMLA